MHQLLLDLSHTKMIRCEHPLKVPIISAFTLIKKTKLENVCIPAWSWCLKVYPKILKVLQNLPQNKIFRNGISHNFIKILCAHNIKYLIHVLSSASYLFSSLTQQSYCFSFIFELDISKCLRHWLINFSKFSDKSSNLDTNYRLVCINYYLQNNNKRTTIS